MKLFKKGDKIVRYNPWNDEGVVSYQIFTVKSCGKIQMTVERESDGKMLKSFIYPTNTFGNYNWCFKLEELNTDELIIQKGLEFSAEYIKYQFEHYHGRINQFSDSKSFVLAMEECLKKLVKPTVIKYPY